MGFFKGLQATNAYILGRTLKGLSTKRKLKGIRNLMKNGMLTADEVAKKIAEASEKDMKKQVRVAVKEGRAITEGDLTRTLDDDPDFMELCKEVGLSRGFFEGLAENVMADSKKEEGGNNERKVVIGRNQPCPCGSGRKYKRCCGKDK